MKCLLTYSIFVMSCFLSGSCESDRKTLPQQLPGEYIGTAPCPHCRGVYSKIAFSEDRTVKLTSDPEDFHFLKGRSGQWQICDSIVKVSIGKDTLYYKVRSSCEIITLYRDRANPCLFKEGYSLYKDTVR